MLSILRILRSGQAVLVLGAVVGIALAASSATVSRAQEPGSDPGRKLCSLEQIQTLVTRGTDPTRECQGGWAPYPEAGPASAETQATALPEALLTTCPYTTGGDYVHLSSTPFAASGHGWWNTTNYSLCPDYADVEVDLQAYYHIGSYYYWVTVANPPDERIRPKNIYGQQATARRDCGASTSTGWRSIVDVDLVGVSDPSDKLYTTPVNLSCSPS